jgi:hypothetical protein
MPGLRTSLRPSAPHESTSSRARLLDEHEVSLREIPFAAPQKPFQWMRGRGATSRGRAELDKTSEHSVLFDYTRHRSPTWHTSSIIATTSSSVNA